MVIGFVTNTIYEVFFLSVKRMHRSDRCKQEGIWLAAVRGTVRLKHVVQTYAAAIHDCIQFMPKVAFTMSLLTTFVIAGPR